MSNDPKDTKVDLSKLAKSQPQATKSASTKTIKTSSTSSMITSCNESAGLVGHENFTYNGNINQGKDD